MTDPDLSALPPPTPGPEMRRDAEWQRLDPRMLLVHPIREVIRFLPVLIVVVVASTAAGGEQWQLIGVAIPIALGLLRYLTTSFRINSGRIELKRGLLNRHVFSTPVDRVRTVDLTSSLIHRLLGLTKVRIGTGTASTSDEDRIDLDGLPLDRARALRAELLRTSTPDDELAAEQAPERDVVTFDPSWVRFAPLTGSGVVIGAAALGAGASCCSRSASSSGSTRRRSTCPDSRSCRAGPAAGARRSWWSSPCSRSAGTSSRTGGSA